MSGEGKPRRKWGFGKRKDAPTPSASAPEATPPWTAPPPRPTAERIQPERTQPERTQPDPALAPPGFHVYRPSSADHPTSPDTREDDDR